MSLVSGTSSFLTAGLLASGTYSTVRTLYGHIQSRHLEDRVLQRLTRDDIFMSDLSCLDNEVWLQRMEEAGSLQTITTALKELERSSAHGHLSVAGSGIRQQADKSRVVTDRPVPSLMARQHQVEAYFRDYDIPRSSPYPLQAVHGGSVSKPLALFPPPPVRLDTDDKVNILMLLEYAGFHYTSPNSDAAHYATTVFKAGRDFVSLSKLDRITFDWDHTLSNFQIFEQIGPIIKAKLSKQAPDEALASTPMTALEAARPYMQELALGMMVGYALHQGLPDFSQWEKYEPRVGIVTHTWPDRLGILATHFSRFLPLVEGLLPGTPGMYERIAGPQVKSVIHLHHFLIYAQDLLTRFQIGGFDALTPEECDEIMSYFEDGKAHYRKPLGALAMKGWETSTLLHFDDSTKVIGDLQNHVRGKAIRGLWVRQPHSRSKDVGELNKIMLSALWRSREAARLSAARNLLRAEEKGSTIPYLLSALRLVRFDSQHQPPGHRAPLSSGLIFMIHETPTTVGEYWRYYVQPTNLLKEQICEITRQSGGIPALRRKYASARKNP